MAWDQPKAFKTAIRCRIFALFRGQCRIHLHTYIRRSFTTPIRDDETSPCTYKMPALTLRLSQGSSLATIRGDMRRILTRHHPRKGIPDCHIDLTIVEDQTLIVVHLTILVLDLPMISWWDDTYGSVFKRSGDFHSRSNESGHHTIRSLEMVPPSASFRQSSSRNAIGFLVLRPSRILPGLRRPPDAV